MVLSATWTERLAAHFMGLFPERESAWRRIGREGEHPVVHADGTAADISVLWPHLQRSSPGELVREGELIVALECEHVTFTSEVGRGTLEIIVGPEDDLHGIRQRYEDAMAHLLAAAEAEGLVVLGYGVQPQTEGSRELMTPKRRYGVLHEVLGDAWLWFSVTASDQVHVDVSRSEVLAVNDLANLLSPAVVALCANSSVIGGAPAGVQSSREARMGTIHAEGHRHGMTEGPASQGEAWIGRTMGLSYLMRRAEDGLTPVGRPFGEWLDDQEDVSIDAAFDAWLLHEHYIWNSARPRTAHGTVELRAACQQPWSDHMVSAALGTAIVQGWREIAAWLDELFDGDPWPALRAWHGEVVRSGLSAPEPADGFLEGLLARCDAALASRGRGEEVYLAPLHQRVAVGRNPAAEALAAFESGGVAALVERARIS